MEDCFYIYKKRLRNFLVSFYYCIEKNTLKCRKRYQKIGFGENKMPAWYNLKVNKKCAFKYRGDIC